MAQIKPVAKKKMENLIVKMKEKEIQLMKFDCYLSAPKPPKVMLINKAVDHL